MSWQQRNLVVGTKRAIYQSMANALATSVLVILFCVLPLVADDGICQSMVVSQGYVCEDHEVTTKDGYILGMQRIPVGRSGKKPDKPPVLLQHGLLVDAVTWLLNPPGESLAFILADNGFDVWLANTRGTKSSRGHKSLSPSDAAYWDWSWDELAAYDLPASFQYVHDQTGQNLHYVGHSLGTLTALAAFSQMNLLTMLRSAALLAPIAYLGQMPSPFARVLADGFIAEDLYLLGFVEFAPGGEAAARLLKLICDIRQSDCADLMTAVTGKNCCLNASTTDIFLENEPQSSATKNLIHLAQKSTCTAKFARLAIVVLLVQDIDRCILGDRRPLNPKHRWEDESVLRKECHTLDSIRFYLFTYLIRQGTLAMYDYGNEDENNIHYGQPAPPVYNTASIPNDLPLFLSYGGQDLLSDVNGVQTLLDTLKDHDAYKLVVQYTENYAHSDFIFGFNAKQVVYDPLVAFFRLH